MVDAVHRDSDDGIRAPENREGETGSLASHDQNDVLRIRSDVVEADGRVVLFDRPNRPARSVVEEGIVVRQLNDGFVTLHSHAGLFVPGPRAGDEDLPCEKALGDADDRSDAERVLAVVDGDRKAVAQRLEERTDFFRGQVEGWDERHDDYMVAYRARR